MLNTKRRMVFIHLLFNIIYCLGGFGKDKKKIPIFKELVCLYLDL